MIPQFLYEMLNEQYGKDLTQKIIEGYCQKRPVTLRVNTLKTTVNSIEQTLKKENIDFEKVSWNEDALILPNSNEFKTNKLLNSHEYEEKNLLNIDIIKEQNLPNNYEHKAQEFSNIDEKRVQDLEIYKNGEIYLQSLSSMMPVIALEPKAKENILDMAAAPGGKTTQIATITQNEAFITACEKNKIRAERLKYNIEKQGAKSINVLIEDARNLSNYFSFDKILLDVPCSRKRNNIFTRQKLRKSIYTRISTKVC